MSEYKGKVVAITGAASGIGRCLAQKLAANGAKLSLGDIDGPGLADVEKELKDSGAEILALKMDVSLFDDMKKFSDTTFDTYGRVDYLFNCAGASTGGAVTKAYMKDFEWVFAVNTLSLVYAAKTFVVRMAQQEQESHVINTLSIAALMSLQTMQPYAASKVAGLAISESLEWELRGAKAKVRVHCLCPAFVATNFGDIEKRRPPQYALDAEGIAFKKTPDQIAGEALSKKLVTSGIPVEKCVDIALEGVRNGAFVIHTHPQAVLYLKKWWSNLLDGKPGYFDNPLDISSMTK